MKTEGTFKYNGEDLAFMKQWAGTQNPHEAIEAVINLAMMQLKDPNVLLKELKDGRMVKESVE